jgi:hypothetical protein
MNILIAAVLIMNSLFILYTILAVTLRMTLSGVGIVDSLPIALYVAPLLVFLPLMILAYLRDKAALWNFILLIIGCIVFGMLSLLIRGFLIVLTLNIVGLIMIFMLGRFRPRGSLRGAGKRGLAFLLLLNVLGLTFPISVVVMGQSPVAIVQVSQGAHITLNVPLADFDYQYKEVVPSAGLISNLTAFSLSLNFQVLEDNAQSWSRLRSWLLVLNATNVSYSITLAANRGVLREQNSATLGTTQLIEEIYHSHQIAFLYLLNTTLSGITNSPDRVIFDMTLSDSEWQALMIEIRNVNLIGFSSLLRATIESIDLTQVESYADSLYGVTVNTQISTGVLVEPFVVDDIQDNDTLSMMVCGLTVKSLQEWDTIWVLVSRSRFSFGMNGDVGEYLAYSYSSSIAKLGDRWSIFLSHIGNSTDLFDRSDNTYTSLSVIANDISLSSGNGVKMITLDSLPAIQECFGERSLAALVKAIESYGQGIATYTFRIYAFRAVFMAIDAFDPLML